MHELDDRELIGPASLPAGVTPASLAGGGDRTLHGGAPAAPALDDVPDNAGHVAGELRVVSSNAQRPYHAPASHPYEDPRFPPPAPALHNGCLIDAAGAILPWWTTRNSTSSAAAAGWQPAAGAA